MCDLKTTSVVLYIVQIKLYLNIMVKRDKYLDEIPNLSTIYRFIKITASNNNIICGYII